MHGLLVIAQISEDKKVTEVIDLWSEDTKQDAWFSQSAMDVGFQWMEKELPGFRVYLFSGEHTCLFVEFSGPFKVVQLATNVFDMKNTLYKKSEQWLGVRCIAKSKQFFLC